MTQLPPFRLWLIQEKKAQWQTRCYSTRMKCWCPGKVPSSDFWVIQPEARGVPSRGTRRLEAHLISRLWASGFYSPPSVIVHWNCTISLSQHYKEKSPNTTVPGLLLHCAALFCGHMVGYCLGRRFSGNKQAYLQTARSSKWWVTQKEVEAVRHGCPACPGVRHWALCILRTWSTTAQLSAGAIFKRSAQFSSSSRTT